MRLLAGRFLKKLAMKKASLLYEYWLDLFIVARESLTRPSPIIKESYQVMKNPQKPVIPFLIAIALHSEMLESSIYIRIDLKRQLNLSKKVWAYTKQGASTSSNMKSLLLICTLHTLKLSWGIQVDFRSVLRISKKPLNDIPGWVFLVKLLKPTFSSTNHDPKTKLRPKSSMRKPSTRSSTINWSYLSKSTSANCYWMNWNSMEKKLSFKNSEMYWEEYQGQQTSNVQLPHSSGYIFSKRSWQ